MTELRLSAEVELKLIGLVKEQFKIISAQNSEEREKIELQIAIFERSMGAIDVESRAVLESVSKNNMTSEEYLHAIQSSLADLRNKGDRIEGLDCGVSEIRRTLADLRTSFTERISATDKKVSDISGIYTEAAKNLTGNLMGSFKRDFSNEVGRLRKLIEGMEKDKKEDVKKFDKFKTGLYLKAISGLVAVIGVFGTVIWRTFAYIFEITMKGVTP